MTDDDITAISNLVDTLFEAVDERTEAAIERFKEHVVGDSGEDMLSILDTMRKTVTAYINLQEEVFQAQDRIEQLEKRVVELETRHLFRVVNTVDAVARNTIKGDNK